MNRFWQTCCVASLHFLLFPVQYAIFDCFVSDLQEFPRLWLDLKLENDISFQWKVWNSFLMYVFFLTKIALKCPWMIFDFGKLKNSINCSCIFRKSIASHIMLCNSVRHFYYRLGIAATAMRAQMSKISAILKIVNIKERKLFTK